MKKAKQIVEMVQYIDEALAGQIWHEMASGPLKKKLTNLLLDQIVGDQRELRLKIISEMADT